MYWNILKNLFLGLFGVGIIILALTFASHYVKELSDGFFSAYLSITWGGYIGIRIFEKEFQSKK